MTNYVEIIGEYYPGVLVYSNDPYDYNAIEWGTEQPIAIEVLDDLELDQYKDEHIASMSAQAEADIVKGFYSTALGSPGYWYDSAHEDQLNLIGSTTAGDDMNYSCRDVQNGPKTYRLHTHAQLEQVVRDGRDVKLDILQIFNTKKTQILAATTKTAVDAIVW